MKEQLAIIAKDDLGFGLRDAGYPILWFNVMTSEYCGALQVFSDWSDIKQIIMDADVKNIMDLAGKPCWVTVDGNLIRFERMWKK